MMIDDTFMRLLQRPCSGVYRAAAYSGRCAALLPRGRVFRLPWFVTFLAAVQMLLLPINFGVLIVDQSLPRVAALGAGRSARREAWLVWEGKDGATVSYSQCTAWRTHARHFATRDVRRSG